MSEEDSEEYDEEIVETSKENEKKILTQILVQDRIYANFLSLSEFVQVVCTRTEQIERGAQIYTTPSIQPHEIAIKEIIEKSCPLTIHRKRGEDSQYEYIEAWEVNELDVTQKCISQVETVLDKNGKINIVEKLNELLKF
jgi:DNA-directed RNA polymerase subunit K/omega